MLRRVIEADQLPDYMMEPAKSPAIMFRRRGEAMALAKQTQAEEDRRARFDADRRRTK